MVAKIYIARTDVAGAGEHSYYVYDPDGDPTTGDEKIISGGPKDGLGIDEYIIEANRDISQSRWGLAGDDPYADRYYTTVATGSDSAVLAIWNQMVTAATGYGAATSDPDYVGQTFYQLREDDYFLFAPNCNTLTNSVGEAVGIDVATNLPKIGGDVGNGERMPLRQYIGMGSLFLTDGDNSIVLDKDASTVLDQGGADTYTFDVATLGNFKGTFEIFEDTNTATTDKVVLQNVDPADVQFLRDPFGNLHVCLEGRFTPLMVIHDQFEGGGAKVNTLWVYPVGGGSPVVLPLSNPDNFDFLGPPNALAGWVPGVVDAFHNGEAAGSPIVLDIDMSGTIELVAKNAAGSVYWDIDSDGYAEASGWITGGDGLLCVDANSDGVITQNELFGNDTTYANGYLKLDALYDTNGSDTVTSADTGFANLRVWVDANADGFSQAAELHTLSSLGITSIASSYSTVNYQIAGNQISQQSTFTMNGNSYTSVDAWFSYDNVNSEYAGSYTLDVRTLFLPDLRGYGTLPDLHIAMSQDSTLLGLVEAIATADASTLLTSDLGLYDRFEQVLFHWANVEGVAIGSRSTAGGNIFDARRLEFMEEFMGENFFQTGVPGGSPNPGNGPLPHLQFAWNEIVMNVMGAALLQTDIGTKVVTGGAYDAVTGAYTGTASLNMAGLQSLADAIALNSHNFQKVSTWSIVFKMIDMSVGLSTLTTPQKTDLMTIVNGSITGFNVSYADLADIATGLGTTATTGDSSDNLLIAGANVWSSSPGGALSGLGGNDILISGIGASELSGGGGDDLYVFRNGDGLDVVNESLSSGTDAIILSGYDTQAIRLRTDQWGSLLIENENSVNAYGPSDLITVYGGTSGGTNQSTIGQYVESIKFDDGTVWSLTGGLTLEVTNMVGGTGNTLYGTTFNDTLIGSANGNVLYGNGGNDTIYAYGGGDQLYGGGGDDVYVFQPGDGQDLITESLASGTDEIRLTGYAVQDIRIRTDQWGSLLIENENNASDVVTIYAGVVAGTTQSTIGQYVERITFQDGTIWDLTGGLTLEVTNTVGGTGNTLYGTAYNDTLIGSTNSNALNGNDGDDTIYGNGNADSLYGGNGADLLFGGSGNDWLEGGSGTDTVSYALATSGVTVNLATVGQQNTGGAGLDTLVTVENLIGSAYNDTLTGDGNANVFEGGLGNNTMNGAGGTDTLTYASATAGITLSLANASAQNTGGAGTDTVSAFENLTGSAYADTLSGDANANVIDGGTGDDVIEGGAGNDTLTGGAGTDRVSYAGAASAVTVNLATLTAQNTLGAGTDTLAGFENLLGSAFNDTLTGDGNANEMEGGAGNDTINGAGGTDTLTYRLAAAAVTVNLATTTGQNTGGAGTDTITNMENLIGSAFNDTLTGNGSANLIEGGAGNDTINGAGGTDMVSYASASAAVTVNLTTTTGQNTGGAGTDTITNTEDLRGSAYNDTLTGNTSANLIEGGAGNDTLNGGNGNDTLNGGAGNDTINGDAGTDTVTYADATAAISVSLAVTTAQNTGGAGTDTIGTMENLTGSIYADTLTGNSSANTILGGDGDDTIDGGAGNDTLTGGNGVDTLSYASASAAVTVNLATTTGQNTVGAGTDTVTTFENLTGSAFNDALTGDGNANVIRGGAGNDTLSASGGNDVLYGGDGLDVLSGGLGQDRFVFEVASAYNNIDSVADFNTGQGDAIDIAALIDPYDPLTHLITDWVQIATNGANSTLSIDRDGTGTVYGFVQVATLSGVTGLTDEAALVASGNLIVT